MPRANVKPERSHVAAKIRVGGTVMPAFAKKLSAAEIDTLIDYMESK
jgi:mono/diheme cytochrome c family protein